MEKIDNRTMPVYLKEEIAKAAESDKNLAKALKDKSFDAMIADMWSAIRKFAQTAGSGNIGVNVPNPVTLSIAIHWYTEDKPTIDSMVAMMKEGGCVFKNESPSPKATSKPSPKGGSTRVEAPKPKVDAKPAKPVVLPKPKAVVEVVSMDDDFDVD